MTFNYITTLKWVNNCLNKLFQTNKINLYQSNLRKVVLEPIRKCGQFYILQFISNFLFVSAVMLTNIIQVFPLQLI